MKQLTKKQFQNKIIPIGYISAMVSFFCFLFGLFALCFLITAIVNTAMLNRDRVMSAFFILMIVLFTLGACSLCYFILMNKKRKVRITEMYFSRYKEHGFIQRRFEFPACVVPTFVLMIEQKGCDFTQSDYDQVWQLFCRFIDEEKGLDELNRVMSRIQNGEVKNQNEYRDIVVAFYDYLQKTNQYTKAKVYVIPDDKLPDYNMRHRVLNIIYDQGKVVYLRK